MSSFFASAGVEGDDGVVLEDEFDALEGDEGVVGVVCGLVEGVVVDGDESPWDVWPVLDDDDEEPLPVLGVVPEFVVVGVFGSPPVERAEALA